MPRIKLTPTSVRTAQAKGKDRTIFWDAHMPGFGLQVTSTGEKSYVIQYRANRRSRRMFIGRDGVLNLDAARKLAKAKLGEVAHDRDPLQERRDKIARERYTFRAVADTYLAREGKKLRTSTSRERRRTLERLVYPEFGSRPIAEIRRSEIVKLLDKIEDNNGAVMADRTLGHVRKIMNWHATRDDDFRSPIVMGMARTSAKERAKTRSLSDDELQAVWKAADKTEGPFGAFVKFLLLTAARRAEAAGMSWDEIKDGVWTLPAARNKTGQELVRPLSGAAQNVLRGLHRIGPQVFTFDGVTPLAGFSKPKGRLDNASGVKGWTLHDLRRTARSLLSRAGIASDVAEMCLGHVLPGVRGIYDRHKYFEEKRHAFEALAGLIERIVEPQDNVRVLRG